MGFWNNLFNKDKEAKVDQAQIMKLMQNPEVRKLMSELQSKLTKEEQKELMMLAATGNFKKINEFLGAKVPDWEDMVRRSGIEQGLR